MSQRTRQNNFSRKLFDLISNPYVFLWLICSVLFGCLFIRFILGNYAYIYRDVGRDTLDINYPLFSYFSDVFHGKGYSDYCVNVGLGMDMSSYWWQYLNPINLMVVLLPKHLIPWGILGAAYLKLLVICIFGYKLMNSWIKSQWPAIAAALLWTFSGYVMLWGQHYGFCTSIALFTVFLYLVHLYIDDGRKSYNWILVPWITLMLISNYYFLYMSGLLAGIYILLYFWLEKKSPLTMVRKLIGLGVMAAFGAGLGGCALVSIYALFSESARSSAASIGNLGALFKPNSLKTMIAAFTRLFSNNLLGIGNDYTGNMNYYEIPVLCTGSLFLFALPYLLGKKQTRWKTLLFSVISLVFLIFPFSGKLFCLNPKAHRWTFIICLLEALCVGLFLKMVSEETDRRYVRKSLFSGVSLFVVGMLVIVFGKNVGEYEICWQYILLVLGFVCVYAILLWRFYGHVQSVPLAKGAYSGVLIGVLVLELAVQNFPTINFRENITRSELASMSYNDGTEQTYGQLKEQDSTLYRVVKSYESESMNDSLVQGYNGLTTYQTTNPRSLITLKNAFGGVGQSVNFVTFPTNQFLFNSLLGVKYLITEPIDPVSEDCYTFVGTMGSKNVYQSNYVLPFGYLYQSAWNWREIRDMDVPLREQAMLYGFFYSDKRSSDTEYEHANYDKSENSVVSLMEHPYTESDCSVTKENHEILIRDMRDDPYIVMDDLKDEIGQNQFLQISMVVSSQEDTEMAVYYRLDGQTDFQGTQLCIFKVPAGTTVWNGTLPGNIDGLRFDVNEMVDEVRIKNIDIDDCTSEHAAFETLRSSDVTNVSWKENVYEADVNVTGHAGMLCIPFLYGKGWSARLDQGEAIVYDINCGLCGIEIPEGAHHVVLCYETPHKKFGVMLSSICLVIYVLWLLGILIQSVKIRKNAKI